MKVTKLLTFSLGLCLSASVFGISGPKIDKSVTTVGQANTIAKESEELDREIEIHQKKIRLLELKRRLKYLEENDDFDCSRYVPRDQSHVQKGSFLEQRTKEREQAQDVVKNKAAEVKKKEQVKNSNDLPSVFIEKVYGIKGHMKAKLKYRGKVNTYAKGDKIGKHIIVQNINSDGVTLKFKDKVFKAK